MVSENWHQFINFVSLLFQFSIHNYFFSSGPTETRLPLPPPPSLKTTTTTSKASTALTSLSQDLSSASSATSAAASLPSTMSSRPTTAAACNKNVHAIASEFEHLSLKRSRPTSRSPTPIPPSTLPDLDSPLALPLPAQKEVQRPRSSTTFAAAKVGVKRLSKIKKSFTQGFSKANCKFCQFR